MLERHDHSLVAKLVSNMTLASLFQGVVEGVVVDSSDKSTKLSVSISVP